LTPVRNLFLLMPFIVALYFMSDTNTALGRRTMAADACAF
jgi:hypothetical protein